MCRSNNLVRYIQHAQKGILLLLLVGCISSGSASAQVSYFVKNNGQIVSSVDSADFIRVFGQPEKASKLYPVSDYYLSGLIKSRGFSTVANLNLIYSGQYIEYFENGQKKLVATFEASLPKGEIYSYYPNGKLYTVTERLYSDDTGKFEERTVMVQDSLGNVTANKGEGYYIKYNTDFKSIAAEGNIVGYVWDGPVKGLVMPEQITYNEVYKAGRLLAGRSKDKGGNIYTYKKESSDAESKDANNNFEDYIDLAVTKLKTNKQWRITENIDAHFNISPEGKVTEVWFSSPVPAAASVEITKMLRAAPPFIPMLKKGVPVTSVGAVSF